jgi:hypothetical protein
MMITLNWQMQIGAVKLTGGELLNIIARGRGAQGVFVILREGLSGTASVFLLRGCVNIGGKDYLFMRPQSSPAEELVVATLLDKDRVCAMDIDRFSSLTNAFNAVLDKTLEPDYAKLEQMLGVAPLC